MAQTERHQSARVRRLFRVCLIGLLFLQGPALAQGSNTTKSQAPLPIAHLPADAQKAHVELRELKATMERALNSMDMDTIIANVTDDLIFTTMNGDVARGPAGIRKYFETMMKGPNPRVEKVTANFVADDLSNLYGNNVAVAYGSSKDQYQLKGGQNFDINARWSATMVRRNDRWLISNFHYSTNVFDNAILDAQRKYALMIGGAIALALALLGFWLGRTSGRKHPA